MCFFMISPHGSYDKDFPPKRENNILEDHFASMLSLQSSFLKIRGILLIIPYSRKGNLTQKGNTLCVKLPFPLYPVGCPTGTAEIQAKLLVQRFAEVTERHGPYASSQPAEPLRPRPGYRPAHRTGWCPCRRWRAARCRRGSQRPGEQHLHPH